MKIITNNISRPILYGFDLTEKEQTEFDFLDWSEDGDGHYNHFFRYKRSVYYLGDFMRLNEYHPFSDWFGYYGETFFSGVLVKFANDGEGVIVASYFT